MQKYENEEYLEKEIMEESRHLFIYGSVSEHRSEFLRSMEKDYPLCMDSNKPIALYFDNLGLSKNKELVRKDDYIKYAISREYLAFSIASKILEKSLVIDNDILNKKLKRLIHLISESRNEGFEEIKTAKELLNEINKSKEFYYKNYIDYVSGSIDNIPINEISIPFLQLELFVMVFKECLNINSYFAILFDKKSEAATSSIQEINNLVNARINKDISIKVAVEVNNWETYRDSNGQFVEATHDYGVIELDKTYKNSIKKLIKNK